MKRRVVIVANVLVPLDRARDGMERSINEMLALLADRDDLQLQVIARRGSSLPASMELIQCDPPECPQEYTIHGDGRSKWDHIANDAAIHEAMSRLPRPDLVHDLSSGTSACHAAVQLGCPAIKTLRLHPAHPSNGLTVAARAWTIHISSFQRNHDRWTPRDKSSVIHDMIPLDMAQPGRPSNERSGLLSVGRVEPRKGHDIAAQVAAKLDMPLKIIGRVTDAEYAREIAAMGTEGIAEKSDRSKAERYKIDLAGEIDHAGVIAALGRCSALVWTPRIDEPGGRVVIEALRAGAVVYALPIGIAADLAESQGLRPEFTDIDAGLLSDIAHHMRVHRIDQLPDAYRQSRDAAAERYASLYHRLASPGR